MSQNHGHRVHHSHDVHHAAGADNERRLLVGLCLTGTFTLVELVGGMLSGSLTLLADAGHMFTDTASLALAFAAFRVGRWPHDRRRTFGYHRFQVLAAFVNGLSLIAIVGWIVIEALRRLADPVAIAGLPMLGIALAGLLVNLVTFAVLHQGDQHNLNIRGAALHVLADLLGSVAALLAALIILRTGWTPADPLLSLLVALLIGRSAWQLVRRSGHILLEGSPDWLDVESLRNELSQAVPAVLDVHHVHAWSLTAERPLITLHARIAAGAPHQATLSAILQVLAERFAIDHATVQIETVESEGVINGPGPTAGARPCPLPQ